jgi:hypothetical protein
MTSSFFFSGLESFVTVFFFFFDRFDVGKALLVVNSDREDYWKVEMKGVFGYVPSSLLEPSPLENYDLVRILLRCFDFWFGSFSSGAHCPLSCRLRKSIA